MPAPDQLLACARTVEDDGWDAVWVSDHPFPVIAAGQHGHHAWDPLAALAFVAAGTTRIVLHTNILVLPYRNPFHTAKAAATLQHLSGGRLALGLGTGYLGPEFAALGAELDGREQMLAEGIDAMEAAWSGTPLWGDGHGWSAEGNSMEPAARPSRVLRGGNSRSAIRHAARSFDGWAPFEITPQAAEQTRTAPLTPGAELAPRIELLRTEAAAAGRRLPEIWLSRGIDVLLRRDRAAAQEELAALEELGVSWLAVAVMPLDEFSPDAYLRGLERLAAVAR
jgi:probable F420-dependent oxidoreductase